MWPLPFDNGFSFDRRARPASSPDVRLTCQVIERILADPQLEREQITVEVQNRVVNLFGTVSSLYARVAAADLARSTPGVIDICNRLVLARTADVTNGLQDLRPDAFDELVANWDSEGEPETARVHRRARAGLLNAAAALMVLVAALMWIVLLPRWGGAGLLIVLPCLAAALALTVLAGRKHGPSHDSDPGTNEASTS